MKIKSKYTNWSPISTNHVGSNAYIVMGRIDLNDGLPEFKEIKINSHTVASNFCTRDIYNPKETILKLFEALNEQAK